ncbi:hypothetical protein ACFOSC_12655 [Streptantibioticus rubrisoli]|uniref:Uncharacterized protein n=1 Tax=Streptantibioticus rubrisoli TaxID=1387313 RepID=A0ABT1P9P5_9ACTN|nr:hypothetical protein [Streptantibioticus rubrisoli]MCQ4041521.1 hypothetical protein [Streptantibioticus rubrisoli]
MALDRTRARYAAMGMCMAVVWLSEGSEPAWEHALRTGVMLLMVPPLLLRAQRRLASKIYECEHPGRFVAQLIAARLLVLVAAFGVSHLLGAVLDPRASHSLVIPGVAVSLAVAAIPLQVRNAYRGRAGAAHPATRPAFSAARLIAAKLTLVIAALLAQLLLSPYVPSPDAVVAVAIAVVVTALGPRVHAHLLVDRTARDRRPAQSAA